MSSITWISSNDTRQWQVNTDIARGGEKANLFLGDADNREIEGFGGCFNELGMIALADLDDAQRDVIFDNLFSPDGECRLNMGRIPIGASDYARSWYSLNETPDDYAMTHFSLARDRQYLIPYLQEALRRQPEMVLFGSPWSPPTWMKTHPVYNYGRLKMDEATLNAYALYFQKFIEHYRAEGIRIAQVHIQNEVAADQKFPSCVWSGEQLRRFIADYLGPRFRAYLPETEIWLGTINAPAFMQEVGEDYDDYANYVLSDTAAYSFVSGVGYQWAGKNAIQRTAESYPELRIYQTENECGDGRNDWSYAHYVFGLFRHYLVNGATGYFYWNPVLATGGESAWGWRQNSMISIDRQQKAVTYNPEYYVVRHFSALVQKGAHRVGVTGKMSGNAIAFRNPDQSLIVNVNNAFGEERELCLSAGGESWRFNLPPGSINSVIVNP
ncbi:glycosyl hydrolase [Brenneria roseae subsp. roseae]|uniref:glycoside hydrolase family 30 protein n=1 Tax=Brenneria roseae TaxID=1509241 RepID=UPI000D6187A1|nr:glycoside hydrolase family 30 protein [Brenneria roseae]PWC20426.1 glycosyl hydrolase [Brenneria roseae subsp. roseae]